MTKRVFAFVLILLAAGLAAPLYGQAPAASASPVVPVPAVSKVMLQARLAELEKAREQAVATANALDGAAQECKYWLEQIAATEKAEADKKAELDKKAVVVEKGKTPLPPPLTPLAKKP